MNCFKRLAMALLCAAAPAASNLDDAATIRAADATTWPSEDWSVVKPESEGLSSERLDKLREYLAEFDSKTGLVVRRGRIVGEWYWGEATAATPQLVYSTSKSVASTAVGLAIARGKLSMDARLGDLLPDVSPIEKREITVRQILSMTTGVANNRDLPQLADRSTYALSRAPMAFPPGTHWEYNNTGLELLAALFAKATGDEIDVFSERELFEPIGVKKADWTWDSNDGHTIPYSGLHITARALARFGLVFLNQGKWGERQVIPADWVAEAVRPSQEINPLYGLLWWNNADGKKWKDAPKDAYAALGRNENDMFVLPSQQMIVVRQVGADPDAKRQVDQNELIRLALAAIDESPSP